MEVLIINLVRGRRLSLKVSINYFKFIAIIIIFIDTYYYCSHAIIT